MTPLNLRGAYGRQAEVKDWFDGKDFMIINGPYCSIRDVPRLKRDGYTHVRLYKFTVAQTADMMEIAL
jgi:hypothetical protein